MKKQRIRTEQRETFEKRFWIKFINSISGYKPAFLVGTTDTSGNTNLAIISSVFHLGATPPLLGFVVRPHSTKSPRHSLENIQASHCYTLNHINKEIFPQAHQTSARYPRETSEFSAVGLTAEYKDGFAAPYVEESPIQIGLQLREVLPIKWNNTQIVIGEIQDCYLNEKAIMPDGYIDLVEAGSLAISGLDSYHEPQRLARLAYAKPQQATRPIPLQGEASAK